MAPLKDWALPAAKLGATRLTRKLRELGYTAASGGAAFQQWPAA